ncbi:MAG: Lrp/AsnC family transcriptional regulator [Selenomonadaceae bacterium]|nr:Lrp/AsnC family transcriptional regulator [Selenomonadaceae bacterium]
MRELTTFEKSLLNFLQKSIPIDSRPFARIAEELNTDEKTVIEKLRELSSEGYLRRIGTFFDSDKLGYQGILAALQVEPSEIENVAKFVNSYSGTTHNYEREGKFNLWFTLLSKDDEQESKILSEIEKCHGVKKMLRLKATRKYKLNVQFKLQ